MKYSSHHRNHSYAFLLLLASVLCSSLVSFVDALGGEGKPAFIPPTAPPPAQERNWENEAASSASDMFTNEDYDAKDHDSYFEDLDDDSALTSSKRGNTEDFGFDIPSDFFSSDEEKTVKVSSAASRARKDRAVASRKYETSSSQSYSGAGGGGMSQVDSLSNEDGRNSLMGGKHVLYEAYNQLHTLAQEFNKGFDAPAVVVVGHQSSGKSALIEALMGFQFNQVGGGTKTRRPVALRMQYNPQCHQPLWFLVGDDGIERPMTLSDIQDYIERENRRLELDPMRSFDSREINIRMEYKNCPNMILIDTPGLISAPRVPRGQPGSSKAVVQQRALQASAKEAEKLVIEKMSCEDYIILCVEDTSDWKHGQTREVVLRADPDLARTVIVNTKFDTKIPQFGSPSDVLDFLRASIVDRMSPNKLGGPFFTSVPSGRVGRAHDDHAANDFLYDNDDDFVNALSAAENTDQTVVAQKLKRSGTVDPEISNRIGLSNLRKFLELRVEECYKRNVQKILPRLQSDYSTAERRLKSIDKEIKALSTDTLKSGADAFCDEFCKCLRKAMKGSIAAPVNIFGETLPQEYQVAGSFHAVKGSPMAVSDRTWERLVEAEVGNKDLRLYGGSQYHRVLREFHLATTCLRLPSITEDEIANAAGLGETHDGVNFLHAACVISIEKARLSFEPMMHALALRMTHVMDRLCPVAEYMLRQKSDRESKNTNLYDTSDSSDSGPGLDVSQNPQFRKLIQTIFEKFVRHCAESAMSRCRDDVTAITRYVTWSLNERGSSALSRALPDQADLISVYRVALQSAKKGRGEATPATKKSQGKKGKAQPEAKEEQPLTPIPSERRHEQEYRNLIQLMEENFVKRDESRTNVVVSGLVQHIVTQWRMQFCNSVISKFNCYFMLPFTDEFHRFVRQELQQLYDGESGDLSEVFDLAAARRSLESTRQELQRECDLNKELREKFRKYSMMMNGA